MAGLVFYLSLGRATAKIPESYLTATVFTLLPPTLSCAVPLTTVAPEEMLVPLIGLVTFNCWGVVSAAAVPVVPDACAETSPILPALFTAATL